ncbi:response regulator [Spirosoma soli]|uniref:Response regulator n=1 Tax=Spirosoma soli TaxID=1770529 RepID=A0ABW5LY94_9BACT
MTNRHNQPTSLRNFRHASLLVVEDNKDHWFLIKMALEQSLPEVEPMWAANREEALQYLNSCLLNGTDLPKLILLDLYLPKREDGWELLQEIKDQSSSFKQVPVVVLSYSNAQEDITESYFHGSTSYVTKPADAQAWMEYTQKLRTYWWETVTLPSDRYMT